MNGRPAGITYSRQGTTPQAGRPLQGLGANPAPNPTIGGGETATSTATAQVAQAVGPYLTHQRGLVFGGFLLCILSPLNFGLEGYMFAGVMLIPTLIAFGLLLAKNRGWTYMTAMILGVLFPTFVTVMFGILGGQTSPMDRGGFWAFCLNLAAIPLILTGGISGFRHARGKTLTGFGPGFRTGTGVFAVAVLALMVGAMTTSYVANQQALASGTAGGYDVIPQATTNLVMEGFVFSPRTVQVTANTYTEIVIENRDAEAHTFTYKNGDNEYNHDLLGGQTVKVLVLFSAAGTYQFWCEPHSNGQGDSDPESMTGEIVVA